MKDYLWIQSNKNVLYIFLYFGNLRFEQIIIIKVEFPINLKKDI